MNESFLISVRVSKDTANRLASLAESTERSKSYLAAQAIEEYLELHEWQIKAVEEGIESADRGEVIEHSKVVDWVKSWGTDKEKEMPECK